MEVIYDLREIDLAAQMLLAVLGNTAIITFTGDLGAGKTTFIQSLCREMGVIDKVSSPTFAIIQQYQTRRGNLIHHLELYRINSTKEAIDAGVEESLFSGDLCLVEWPEKAPELFAEENLHIQLEPLSGDKRKMIFQLP